MPNSTRSVQRRTLTAIAALTTAIVALTGCATGPSSDGDASAEKITLRYSSPLADTASDSVAMKWWFDRVNELTDDQVKFDEFYSASVLTNEEALDGLRSGRADFAYVAIQYFPSELPLTQLASVPFLSENGEATARAFWELSQDGELAAEYDKAGIVPVAWTLLTNNTMGTTSKVETLKDLDGLTLRGSGLSATALAEVGVNVLSLPAPQIYESLQQGVMDGFSSLPFTNAVTAFKVHEVAPHFIDAGLGQYSVSMGAAFSKRAWDDLPANVQDAMKQASEELFAANSEIIDEAATESCKLLAEAGGEVTRLPESDIEYWRALVEDDLVGTWTASATSAGTSAADTEAFFDAYTGKVEELSATANFVDPIGSC